MAAITGTTGSTSTGGAGGGDAAAQAAADEARRKAEEARRAAEEAARRAAEAQAKADAARRSADASERAKAGQLQREADKAKVAAADSAKTAQAAIKDANTAATKAGRAAPYPNTVVRSGSEDSFASGGSDTAALGGDSGASTEETQARLDADREYAKLAGSEDGRAALRELGIEDGGDLRAFTERVASGDAEAIAQLHDATGGNDALAAQVTASMDELNPAAGEAVAEAEQKDEYGVTAQDREDLKAVGLTDEQINEAGAALPHLLAAARAEDPQEALRELAAAAESAPRLVDAAWSGITSRPEVQDFFANELGVDITQVPSPSVLLPKAVALLDAIKTGDAAAVTQAFTDFASSLDPAAFDGVLEKLGDFLPAPVRDFLSGLAGDENVQAALAALASDPNLPALVQAIVDGDVKELLTTLAANPAFLTAAGKAVAGIPAVKDLFAKLGIDPEQVENLQELLTAVASDENLPQIVESLANGEIEDAFALLAQNPEVVTALGEILADLPVVQELAEKLGIDLSALPDLGAALPDLLALKDALATGDVSAIAQGLVKVGQPLGSEAFTGMWSKLAEQLPPAVAEFFGGLVGNENLQDALEALASDPNLPALAQAIEDGDVAELLTTLAKNPAFLTAAGEAIADIPGVKALFDKLGLDPAQVEDLQSLLTALANDPNLPEIVSALTENRIDDALALLVQNEAALTAVGELVAELPAVKALAEKLGIDLSALPDLGAALPDLIALKDAIAAGDVSAIAEGLVKVGQLLGSEAFSGMWSKLAAQLPPAVAEFFGDLVSNPDLQGALQALASDPNLPALAQAIEDGDFGEVVKLLGENAAFMENASDLLLSIGPVKAFLTDTLGLTEEEISSISRALPDVVAALGAETPEEAIEHLLSAAAKISDSGLAQKLLQKVVDSDAYQKLPEQARQVIESLLGDPELQAFAQALVDDPNFSSIVADLAAGELGSALEQILANPAAVTAGGAALLDIPAVKNFVAEKLGIEPERVKDLAAALPELFAALKSGTAEEAIDHLLAAGAAIPADLLNSILGNLGGQIADALHLDAPTRDFLQSVLTDPALPELLKNSADTLKTALQQVLSGEVDDALDTLFSDPALVGFIGEKFLQIPAVKAKVGQLFGLTPEEVDGLGGAASELLRAYSAATQDPPDLYEASLHAMGALASLPLETAQKMFGKLADALGLPQGLRDAVNNALPTIHGLLQDPNARQAVAELLAGNTTGALNTILSHPETAATLIGAVGEMLGLSPEIVGAIQAAAPLLSDPAFQGPLKDLLGALAHGNVDAALSALGSLGSAVQDLAEAKDPRLTQLFNALGMLPGGLGEIFSNPELNAYIVESGTAASLFSAAEKLAHGDLEGAAAALFEAAGDMLGAGDGPSIEIPGANMKITEEGARMFAQLFQNLFNALPNGVKNEIKAFIGRALGGSIPILGSLITGAMDAKEFYDALKDGDTLDQFIAGTQLLLDGAGLVLQGAVTPLKLVLAALQAYRAIGNMAEVVDGAAGIFLGVQTDPDEEALSEEEAMVLSYFGGDTEAAQAAMAVPPLSEISGDPRATAAALEAARAAGISAEELPAFLQALLDGYRGEYGEDATLSELAELLARSANGEGMGGRADLHQTNARLLQFMRQFLSDDQIRDLGGSVPETWENLQDEDAYGIPDALDQLQDEFPELEHLPKSSLDALVVAAQALGIPPEEFMNWVRGMREAGGPEQLLQLIDAISERNRYFGMGMYYPDNYDIGAVAVDAVNSMYPGLADQYDGE